MKYLVDANVLSEATKADPQPSVVQWLSEHERDLVINSIILGELFFGILLLPKSNRRKRLMQWFNEGARRLHCLPWDSQTALHWAELLARLRKSGRSMPVKDSLIAATAIAHELTVVTRNVRDFEKTAAVKLFNPFETH